MKHHLLLFLGFFSLLLCPVLQAQDNIHWMSFEEAVEASERIPKKILVDMYTDWCGWCKKMNSDTYHHPEIAQYINENFYPVKFNAESKEDVVFQGDVFSFVKQGNRGYHELAVKLSERLGRLSFPTVVFIDENLNIIQPLAGFLKAEQFKTIVSYIAEDHYLRTPWKKYEDNFEGLASPRN